MNVCVLCPFGTGYCVKCAWGAALTIFLDKSFGNQFLVLTGKSKASYEGWGSFCYSWPLKKLFPNKIQPL